MRMHGLKMQNSDVTKLKDMSPQKYLNKTGRIIYSPLARFGWGGDHVSIPSL